jgi:dolichol kinase
MGQSAYSAVAIRRTHVSSEEVRIEVLRKSIHLLVALVPTLASFLGVVPMVGLLAVGTLCYASCEALRMNGTEVPVISRVTALAARRRDSGKFVLGPITLGLGAMLSLMLYPNPAASVAIYTLAFGDGLSSLVGKLFGTIRLPFTGGKSLEGSMTCFIAVFVSALALSRKPLASAAVALVATLTEAMPLKDFDNIVLPVVAGGMALLLL